MKRYFGAKAAVLTAIIFAILMQCGLSSFAEDTELSKELELLNALEISNNSLALQETVTRAEFAEYALKLINIHPEKIGFSQADSFLDIPQNSKFASAVGIISDLKAMIGSDGFFYPNRRITMIEAVSVLTRLLGYEEEAILRGGYPQGYYSFGISRGMLDRINTPMEQEASGVDICRLLYNCLEIPAVNIRSLNVNGGYISIPKGAAMEQVFGVYKSGGIVDANALTALTGESKLRDDQISVDGRTFNIGLTETSGLLGCYISFFYRYDKELDENVLLSVNASKNVTLTINAEDITEFSNNVYRFYGKDDRLHSVSMSLQADVIYNGKAIEAGFSDWRPSYGNVVLIDRNSDGKYDCVQITSYRIAVVSNVDAHNRRIYDKCNIANPVELDTDKKIKISDQNGYMVEISSIAANDVIAIAESKDKNVLQLVVWNEKITGKAEGVSSPDGEKEVLIKNSSYKLTAGYSQSGAPEIRLGDRGTFYMYDKYIAYFEPEISSVYKFGYILKKIQSEEDMCRYYLKLITQDNKIETFALAEKIHLDESRVRTEKSFDEIAEQQLVRYMLNAEGEISKIDRAPAYQDKFRDKNDREGLWQENELKQSLKYRSEGKSFEGRFKISDSTVVFAIPENTPEDYEEYFVGGTNLLTDDKTHKVTAFSVSPKSEYCEALLAYGVSAKNITTNTPIMLVEAVEMSIDADDNPVYEIKGLYSGKRTSLFTEDMDVLDSLSQQIGPGDIIRFAKDANNVIKEVKLYFDYSEQSLTDEASSPFYTAGARFIYKNVYRRNNNTLFVTGEPVGKKGLKSSEIERVPSTTIYVYEGKEARIGSINDVRSYEEFGSDYSKIVYFTVYGLPRTLVVYQ